MVKGLFRVEATLVKNILHYVMMLLGILAKNVHQMGHVMFLKKKQSG